MKDLVSIFFCVIKNKTNQLSRQAGVPFMISSIRFSCVLPPKSSYALLFSSVQLLSHVRLFATPWTAACQASLSITNSQSLLKIISNQWCHPTISSSVIPYSSCLQSFLASGSFPRSQFFASGGQSIGASVLPMNILDWFPLRLTGLISLQSKGPSRVFSNITVQKHQFLVLSPTLTSINDYWKTIALTRWIFVGKVMSLVFNMLCVGWS